MSTTRTSSFDSVASEAVAAPFLRATVRDMIPGSGPSSCIAFLSVSIACGFGFPNNESPLMFTSCRWFLNTF